MICEVTDKMGGKIKVTFYRRLVQGKHEKNGVSLKKIFLGQDNFFNHVTICPNLLDFCQNPSKKMLRGDDCYYELFLLVGIFKAHKTN